jgi:hypothetical protein
MRKMADTKTSELLKAPVLTHTTEANNELVCSCCYQTKLKLEEVLLELSLAKEIIKLLQEERNIDVSTDMRNTNHGLEYDQFNKKLDDWVQVPDNRSKRSRISHIHYPRPIPTILNRFAPLHNLSNLNEDSKAVKTLEDSIELNGKKNLKLQSSNQEKITKLSQLSSTIGASKAGNKRKHKVVIIGDSHSRGLAKEVQNHVNKNFEVSGLVKPGTGAEIILNLATSDIVNLSKSDVVVFCGGSNDVSKNKVNVALKHISNFVKANNNTNIILLSAPHRQDLMDSCVNNEIKSFNRKLLKHVKTINHTEVLEINPNRECFTQNGLHLNGRGKEKVAKQIQSNFPQS